MSVNARLEMFCDGVFAIAITLLVLEIKVPPHDTIASVKDIWRAVLHLWPSFFALFWSFLIILIAWLNHHQLLKLAHGTSPHFQYANALLLFSVVLIPFFTAFIAEYLNTPYAQPAITMYCANTLLHNVGWIALFRSMLRPKPLVRPEVLEQVRKDAMSANMGFVLYGALVLLSFWFPITALILNFLTWCYWLYFGIRMKGDPSGGG